MNIYKKINNKKYFKQNIKKEYNIYLCDKVDKINKMVSFFKNTIQKNKKLIIGIDFEFNNINNKREIALCQMNIEDHNNGNIFIFYPPDLNNNQMKIFKNLLTNGNFLKILHGGESLDIPYLFNNILLTKEDRINFCNNLIDTRYLCEYYFLKNKIVDFKCKINSILLKLDIIDKKIFDYLLDVEDKMGPIYNIIIDVNKLNELILIYTVTDVLYLPQLYLQFNKKNNLNLIKYITSYSLIEKDTLKKNNEILNKFNNYYIKSINYKLSLSWLFYQIKYMIEDENYKILININFFKKFFDYFVKYYVFEQVINNYEIWKNKNEKVNEIDIINFNIIKNNIYFKKLEIYIENILKKSIKEML